MVAFSGIGKAQEYKSGRYLDPGTYTLSIASITLVDSKKEKGRKFFVVEAEVLSSNNPDFRVGDLVTWMVDITPKLVEGEIVVPEISLSNCKAFAKAVLDCTDNDITEETMDKLCGPEQPASGINVVADAFNITTGKGGEFTKIRWSAAPVAS